MNQVAKYSLQPIARQEASKQVASLFAAGLHSQNKGALNDALVESYLENVSDIPEWAVTEAVELYRKGLKGNGKFVPSPQELSQTARDLIEKAKEREWTLHARKVRAEKLAKEIEENERYKAIRAGVTPESKARVQKLLEQTQANIAAAKLLNEENLPPERPNALPDMKETQDRFKDQGREATIKTLKEQNA